MVRHGDPGVPSWLVDSGEVSPADTNRMIEFSTSVTESVLVTYNVNHSVTVQQLIDVGLLGSGDDFNDRSVINDAISEYISNDYIDRYDDDDPYHGDSDYYDSDWDISDYGDTN